MDFLPWLARSYILTREWDKAFIEQLLQVGVEVFELGRWKLLLLARSGGGYGASSCRSGGVGSRAGLGVGAGEGLRMFDFAFVALVRLVGCREDDPGS